MQTISGPFQFGNSTFEWGGGKSCDDAGFLKLIKFKLALEFLHKFFKQSK